MPTLTELVVKIGADLGEFNREMSGVTGKLNKVGEDLKSIGSTLSTRLTVPLLAVGAGMIKAASDAEEMQAKFDKVFANTGAGVTASIDEFATTVGRSTFELRGMASQLGDTLKPMGFTEEAAAGLSVDLVKLATDLSSFNNMSMDEALRRLQGTLVGSHENALAFGVVINENTLKARMHEKGLDKLTGAALEQAKVQTRINLLFEGTSDAQGDATRTAESFANRMRGLIATVKDLSVEFGNQLLPLATRVIEALRGMITWISDLDADKKRLILTIGGVAAALGPLAIGFGVLLTAINPISLAIAGVIAAGAAIMLNWDSIVGYVNTEWPALAAGLTAVWDGLKVVFNAAKDQMMIVFGFMQDIWGAAFLYFSSVWDTFSALFRGDWQGVWDGIKGIFTAVWDGVKAAFRAALDTIVGMLPDFVTEWLGIQSDVETATEAMGTAVGGLADDATTAAGTLSGSGGITEALTGAESAARSAAGGYDLVTVAVGKTKKNASEAELGITSLVVSLDQLRGHAGDAQIATGNFIAAIEPMKARSLESEGAVRDLAGALDDVPDALPDYDFAGITPPETTQTGWENLIGSFTNFKQDISLLTDAFKDLEAGMKEIGLPDWLTSGIGKVGEFIAKLDTLISTWDSLVKIYEAFNDVWVLILRIADKIIGFLGSLRNPAGSNEFNLGGPQLGSPGTPGLPSGFGINTGGVPNINAGGFNVNTLSLLSLGIDAFTGGSGLQEDFDWGAFAIWLESQDSVLPTGFDLGGGPNTDFPNPFGRFQDMGGITVNVNMDGQTFARTVLPHMEREIELNIGG